VPVKLGVFTVLFRDMPFEAMLDFVKAHGIEAVEIGAGGYPGKDHCDPAVLLADEAKRKAFKKAVEERGLLISALSVHGNPLHPQKEVAQRFHDDFVQTVLLAEQLEVPVVNVFSGCPGDHEGAKYPNWPVMAWPHDFQEVLEWQWREKIIPYWKEWGKFAADHHVKLAFELHGGFSVHSPDTLLKLREAVGEVIGANLDPSHLFWQGIDPVQAIRILGSAGAIFHVHAKDTGIDWGNAARNGLLDARPFTDLANRSWIFRTVGFGHDLKVWRDIVSALRLVGYDYVLSIEHEDALMSPQEGFRKAVANLKQVIMEEPVGDIWWA
jgi:Sugar phosphate isomerases/epimerases